MSSTSGLLRRTAFIVSIAAFIAVLMAWRRDRLGPGDPDAQPEWPEFTSATPEPSGTEPASAPEEVSPAWMAPLDGGSCPPDHNIKAKESSGIYHIPGGRFYERTKPDRCYASAAAAEADGYRQSKS